MPVAMQAACVVLVSAFCLLNGALGFSGVVAVKSVGGLRRPSETGALASSTTENDGGQEKQQVSYQIRLEYSATPSIDWTLRSFWMAQELLTTFAQQEDLTALTLVPCSKADHYSMELAKLENDNNACVEMVNLWDYQEQGRIFPETKILKQKLRDSINPDLSLGHSDAPDRREENEIKKQKVDAPEILNLEEPSISQKPRPAVESLPYALWPGEDGIEEGHHLVILYCTGCRWMLRASYLAQEIQRHCSSFVRVTLAPSRPPCKQGSFVVQFDGNVLWDRAQEGSFPDPDNLVEKVNAAMGDDPFSELDDEEAADARAYFGVM